MPPSPLTLAAVWAGWWRSRSLADPAGRSAHLGLLALLTLNALDWLRKRQCRNSVMWRQRGVVHRRLRLTANVLALIGRGAGADLAAAPEHGLCVPRAKRSGCRRRARSRAAFANDYESSKAQNSVDYLLRFRWLLWGKDGRAVGQCGMPVFGRVPEVH